MWRWDRELGPPVRGSKLLGTRGYALFVLPIAFDGLHWTRVTRPDDDPRSIRVAERWRMGQVGGELVTFGLTPLWQTERRPSGSGCSR